MGKTLVFITHNISCDRLFNRVQAVTVRLMYERERFTRQLQESLQSIIAESFPSLGFITISGLIVRSDKRSATVYISVSSHAKSVLSILNRSSLSIKEKLNSKMVLRYIPQLEWRLDEQSAKIDDALSRLSHQ